tara:strand:- start:2518 stop:2916 length:399 start_codon:yes stop_codon:yes gene_type:complete
LAVEIRKTQAIEKELDSGVSISLFTNPKLKKLQRILAPDGIYVGCAGEGDDWNGLMKRMMRRWLITAMGRGRIVSYIIKPNATDLTYVADLVATGRVNPVMRVNVRSFASPRIYDQIASITLLNLFARLVKP